MHFSRKQGGRDGGREKQEGFGSNDLTKGISCEVSLNVKGAEKKRLSSFYKFSSHPTI